MSYIVIPSRIRLQPRGALRLNYANDLTRGLWVCVVPGVSRQNLANGRLVVGSSASLAGIGQTAYGQYVNYVQQSMPSFNTNAGYSIFIDFITASSFTGSPGAFGLYASNYACGFYPGNTTANYNGAFWEGNSFLVLGKPTGGALSTSTPYRIGLSRSATGGSSTPRLYSNGVGSDGSPQSIASQTVVEASLGSTRGTAVEPSATQRTAAFYVWSRTLSDAEQWAIADNPWQIFVGEPRRIYFGVGGGATTDAAIAGTQATDVGAIAVAATTGCAIGGTQATDVGAVAVAATTGAAIAGTQASDGAAINVTADVGQVDVAIAGTQATDVGAVAVQATTGTAIAGTQASDVAAVEVTASTGQTDVAIAGVQASDVGAVAVSATLGLALSGTQASDVGYIVVAATLPASMAGTQDSDVAAIVVAGLSIWTDIGVTSASWSDLSGATSIWTDL